ncbi:MAG: DUF2939 domain-containing protein [Synechococcaceae bacterium WB8_1B_136]|nr:DUF2939 domain-containing protein [Synechococcaceae bacterium WB8_1B_136]
MTISKAAGSWIGFALIGGGLYLAATPYISINQFREALQQRDLPAIESHVDFPSVRESLKEQLKAKLVEEIAKQSEGESWVNLGLGALGYAIAEPMIDAAVNAYVSPAGLKALMAGSQPEMPSGLQTAAPTNPADSGGTAASDVQLSYKTPNLVVISARDTSPPNQTIKFNFERHNLVNWRLTSISLP